MKDLPPLQWLRSFECAARHLSFTHAAAELSVTQSAISQQVKALENYLGHALFVRRARSLELTDAGFAYLPDIQSAIALLRRSTIANFGENSDRTITIRSNFAFSSLWLVPRLDEFRENNPDVSLHIVPALWESDYRHKNEGVEIRFGTGNWTKNKSVLFGNLESYPVCAPELAKQIAADGDIPDAPLISVSGMSQHWDDFFELVSPSPARKHSTLATPSFNIALEMASLGMGVVLGHDVVCERYLHSGSLVRVSPASLIMQECYYLVYDGDLSAPERSFVQWVTDRTGRSTRTDN